jgi:hypothetical protein
MRPRSERMAAFLQIGGSPPPPLVPKQPDDGPVFWSGMAEDGAT